MKALKRILGFLYPLCFGLAPILSLYALNRAEVHSHELLRPLWLTLVGSLGALLLFYALSRRSGERAALALSVLLTAFFAYGLLQSSLESTYRLVFAYLYPPFLDLFVAYRALVLYVLGLCTLLGLVLWARYEPRQLRIPAWVMGLGYLVPALFTLLRPVPLAPLAGSEPPKETSKPALTDLKTPDLYCVVLDAYGRQDQLQALFGFDNTPFLQALEQRGFRVLTKSHSNYIQTVLCVASLLNLDYLPNDPDAEGLDQASSWIQTGSLMKRMKARGYQIVNIPSDFAPTTFLDADISLSEIGPVTSDRTPFERLLLGRTPFAYTLLDDHPAYDGHRAQILASLSHIADAARLPGPKFVFVHVLAPHPPFVLGSQGEAVYPRKAQYSIGDATDFGQSDPDAYRKGYVAQLQAINAKVLDAVDALQKTSKRPAVIVLLGDHGSRMQTDWKSRERTNLNEAFSNFQAVFVPGGAPYLTDDLTPINTFRLLLTHVYGENLPRLPDKSYYSTLRHSLQFEEVTAKLH